MSSFDRGSENFTIMTRFWSIWKDYGEGRLDLKGLVDATNQMAEDKWTDKAFVQEMLLALINHAERGAAK